MSKYINNTIKQLSAFAISAMILTACQSTPKMPKINTPTQSPTEYREQQATTADEVRKNQAHQFQITGKIGIRTPQQTGSAFYAWHQQDHAYAIDLTGALGIGHVSIQGTSQQVSLSYNKGTLTADTPEQLLQQATGWQAPISQLRWWINGLSASPHAEIQKDTQGRVQYIKEAGWAATLHYEATSSLPNRLNIIDDDQKNRITLTIQSRQ